MALARHEILVVDTEGNVQPSASVTVRREITGSPLAALYSDRDGLTPLGNPFSADIDGVAAFHVAGGAYRIDAVKGAVSRTQRYVAIGLASENDGVGAGVGFTFSTTTTDADPGLGNIRFNNATLASVTQIYIDNDNAVGGDVSAWLSGFDDGGISTDRGTLTLMSVDGTALFTGRVTGSVVDGTGYRKVSITPLVTNGTFLNGAAVYLQFVRSGSDGVNAGIPFTFSSTTSMADPGAGVFRLNNATLSSVTAAAVDDTSAAIGNPDVSAAVLSWDDSTNPNRGYLLIKKISAPENFALYKITGASTDNSGWTQLALTYVTHSGSFSNTDPCIFEFTPSGDRGNLEVAIAIQIDGGGIALTTGIKGDLRVPFACTINSVTMLADQTGSVVVDIWKDTYANYPPTNADSITASAKPTISSGVKSEDTTLTGWTTAVSAGDTLRFNVDSATTITRVTLILKVTKA